MRIHKRESAKRDLILHFVHLAEDAGIGTAERFLARAEDSFKDLTQMPLIGSVVDLRRAELAGLRKWRVKDFDRFLIFYRPLKDYVEIVRVIHAAQDWLAILDD